MMFWPDGKYIEAFTIFFSSKVVAFKKAVFEVNVVQSIVVRT